MVFGCGSPSELIQIQVVFLKPRYRPPPNPSVYDSCQKRKSCQKSIEIKPQLKPRGSVAKEENSKPSHQLEKLHGDGAQEPAS